MPDPMPLTALRVLLAMLGLDVHSKGIRVLARQLRDLGAEVVYLGEHNSPEVVARTALAEDVDVIGLSFSTTTYLSHTRALMVALADLGADIPVVVGGLIHPDDVAELRTAGVAAVFGPGSTLDGISGLLAGLRRADADV